MITMSINSWATYKNLVSTKDLRPQYLETPTTYDILATEGEFCWQIALLKDGGTDVTDFINSHRVNYNQPVSSLDSDGAQVTRNKAAKKGWTYCVDPIEFETSRRSNLMYSKDVNGNNRNGISLRLYDINSNEIVVDGEANANWANAVKTVIDFEPTYDYEIIGGFVGTLNDITQDIRLYIIGAPDIPAQSGGSKEMIGGLNLNFMKPENAFFVDGRVTKFMQYNGNDHRGKMRFILKYPAGVNERVVINVEYYKA